MHLQRLTNKPTPLGSPGNPLPPIPALAARGMVFAAIELFADPTHRVTRVRRDWASKRAAQIKERQSESESPARTQFLGGMNHVFALAANDLCTIEAIDLVGEDLLALRDAGATDSECLDAFIGIAETDEEGHLLCGFLEPRSLLDHRVSLLEPFLVASTMIDEILEDTAMRSARSAMELERIGDIHMLGLFPMSAYLGEGLLLPDAEKKAAFLEGWAIISESLKLVDCYLKSDHHTRFLDKHAK